NVMAEEGKPLGALVADLQKEFGPHYYGRLDLHIPEEVKQGAIKRARSEDSKRLGKYSIVNKENLDGVKFFLDAPTNGDVADAGVVWGAAGRGRLLRSYEEAASPDLLRRILPYAESFVKAGG